VRVVTCRRVGREHDARALRGCHLLHDHSDGRLVVHPLARPVGQHARTEQRRPAVAHARDEVLVAADVRVGLVHAGERRTRRVLGGGGGPDGHIDAVSQAVVGREDVGAQLVGHPCFVHQLLQVRRGQVEPGDVLVVEAGRLRAQLLAHTALVHGSEVRLRGDDEAGRHRQPGAGELAEVGALAARDVDAVHVELLEEPDAVGHDTAVRSECATRYCMSSVRLSTRG
jgi:hypothetical protein